MKFVLVLLFVALFSMSCNTTEEKAENISTNSIALQNNIHYELIKHEQGWSYQIYINNKLFITQEYIPAIEGQILFKTAVEAQKVAGLVIKKMKQSSDFPSVTVQELDSLKISRN